MNITDRVPGMSGRIEIYHINKTTSNRDLVLAKSNIITYSAADLMARIMTGDSDYLPKHIGFMYGTVDSGTTPPDPALTREHSWADVTSDTSAIALGNILIAPLAITPSVSLDGSDTYYANNAVTFTSHTGLGIEYAYTPGSEFAESLDYYNNLAAPVYVYQVLLLNRWEHKGAVIYTPFACAALGAAPFTAKPASNHLAVYWTVTFK